MSWKEHRVARNRLRAGQGWSPRRQYPPPDPSVYPTMKGFTEFYDKSNFADAKEVAMARARELRAGGKYIVWESPGRRGHGTVIWQISVVFPDRPEGKQYNWDMNRQNFDQRYAPGPKEPTKAMKSMVKAIRKAYPGAEFVKVNEIFYPQKGWVSAPDELQTLEGYANAPSYEKGTHVNIKIKQHHKMLGHEWEETHDSDFTTDWLF